MGAAIVLGRDLDVFVIFAPFLVPIFDAQVGEVHLVIEVRQVMFAGPAADLLVGSIGVAIVVGPLAIAFVEPSLVLTLELMIEDDALDSGAAFAQAVRCALISAIDLEIVFEFPFAFDALPERLAATRIAVAVVFDQAPAASRQRDGVLA